MEVKHRGSHIWDFDKLLNVGVSIKHSRIAAFDSAKIIQVKCCLVPCIEGRKNYLLSSPRGATFLDKQVPVGQHF